MCSLIQKTFLTISLIVLLSCTEINKPNPADSTQETKATFGECLENQISTLVEEDSQTIVEYSFIGTTLTINHLNAGFNCCFDFLLISATITGNKIIISEKDINPNCYCLCLRDISYNLLSIEKSNYEIIINEPYLSDNDLPISFNANLNENSTGSIKFNRTSYPWKL